MSYYTYYTFKTAIHIMPDANVVANVVYAKILLSINTSNMYLLTSIPTDAGFITTGS